MISLCIVNWNTRDLLKECLRAIYYNPPPEAFEIIVVDNASPDGSAQLVKDEFPQVHLIANAENRLYAEANNQALEIACGDLILLLNPDTEVKSGCLERLADFLRSRPEASAAAPQLLFPDGTKQSSCRAFPTPRALLLDMLGFARIFPNCKICGEYRMTFFQYDRLQEVDQPMASALMIKRAVLEQIGGFDEGFPMFFNDVDLCLRIKQAGGKIFFLPEAVAIHHHGASTIQRKREMIAQSHASLLRFYRKHYQGRVSRLGYWLIILLSRIGKNLRLMAYTKTAPKPEALTSKCQKRRPIIAIDGPAAAGKSTLAKLLAERLGYLHLDTGAMYRAVGWKAKQLGISFDDIEKVTEIARQLGIRLITSESGGNRVIADGEDISSAIRTMEAGEWASRVSAISGVRRAMVCLQRQMGAEGGVVAEGRDIQTVVFPNAEVKLFLTASVEERARRRFLELQAKGANGNLEEIKREMEKRDARDSTRADSPLKPASDAVIVDTDGKRIEQVVEEVQAVVERIAGA